MQRNIQAGLFAVLLLAVALLMSMAAIAQEAEENPEESITMSPVSTKLNVDAGGTKIGEVTVLNSGSTTFDFIVYTRPYSVTSESYEPNFEKTLPNADAYQWIQFEQTSYTLESRESVKIPFTVRVPEGAAPGGHYGVIFAETQPQGIEGSGVARKKRVGSIVYATVAGAFTSGGEIASIDTPFWQTSAPLTSTARVTNTGNSDFETITEYKVSDIFGRVKYDETKSSPVLPQTTRALNAEWANPSWIGLYKTELKVSFLDKEQTDNSYVLIAPRWAALVLLVLIIGGAVYAVLRRRR